MHIRDLVETLRMKRQLEAALDRVHDESYRQAVQPTQATDLGQLEEKLRMDKISVGNDDGTDDEKYKGNAGIEAHEYMSTCLHACPQ